jgi:hypothetical protein
MVEKKSDFDVDKFLNSLEKNQKKSNFACWSSEKEQKSNHPIKSTGNSSFASHMTQQRRHSPFAAAVTPAKKQERPLSPFAAAVTPAKKQERPLSPFAAACKEERKKNPFAAAVKAESRFSSLAEASKQERRQSPYAAASRQNRPLSPFAAAVQAEGRYASMAEASKQERRQSPYAAPSRQNRPLSPFAAAVQAEGRYSSMAEASKQERRQSPYAAASRPNRPLSPFAAAVQAESRFASMAEASKPERKQSPFAAAIRPNRHNSPFAVSHSNAHGNGYGYGQDAGKAVSNPFASASSKGGKTSASNFSPDDISSKTKKKRAVGVISKSAFHPAIVDQAGDDDGAKKDFVERVACEIIYDYIVNDSKFRNLFNEINEKIKYIITLRHNDLNAPFLKWYVESSRKAGFWVPYIIMRKMDYNMHSEFLEKCREKLSIGASDIALEFQDDVPAVLATTDGTPKCLIGARSGFNDVKDAVLLLNSLIFPEELK